MDDALHDTHLIDKACRIVLAESDALSLLIQYLTEEFVLISLSTEPPLKQLWIDRESAVLYVVCEELECLCLDVVEHSLELVIY